MEIHIYCFCWTTSWRSLPIIIKKPTNLSDENVASSIDGFCWWRSHGNLKNPCHLFDDDLHPTEVIQDVRDTREVDNDRENLNRKINRKLFCNESIWTLNWVRSVMVTSVVFELHDRSSFPSVYQISFGKSYTLCTVENLSPFTSSK